MKEVRWYDITDYEGFHEGNRRNKSPMLSFCYIDKAKVADRTTKEFYQANFFGHWLSTETKNSKIFLAIWCFMRLWNISMFYIFDIGIFYPTSPMVSNSSGNSSLMSTAYSGPCRGNFIHSITAQRLIIGGLMLQNILQLLLDIAEFVYCGLKRRNIWYKWTEKGRKKIAVQVIFYRLTQFAAEICITYGSLNGLYASYTGQIS